MISDNTNNSDWTQAGLDITELIADRHQQIAELFDVALTTTGQDREFALQDLVRALAVHEISEEQLIHPVARQFAGDDTVDALLTAEATIKERLSDIYSHGQDDPDFELDLRDLADATLAHNEAEEREELPRLREGISAAESASLSRDYLTAEDSAPTRPHPEVGEGALANLLAGPPLALFDQIRDLIVGRKV